jgi:hypothetical protein
VSREDSEVVLAERDPNSPGKRFGLTMDRDVETAADKKEFVIDDAGVGIQHAPPATVFGFNSIEM